MSPSLPGIHMDLPVPLPVQVLQPLQWLALGCRDMCRAPLWSLLHGVVLAAGGAIMLYAGYDRFAWLTGVLSGFLVVGPLLATSLYAISRALERHAPVGWKLLHSTWLQWQTSSWRNPDYWCLVQLGVLLSLSALGWIVVSASLVTLLSPMPISTPEDFLRHVVAGNSSLFPLWLALGSCLAAPIFASTVVSMPLLLDRKVTLPQAVLTSWLVILRNPIAMAVWAGVILAFTLLGLASCMLGLVFIMPMLGHASWHAYRDTVDASDFAPRQATAGASA